MKKIIRLIAIIAMITLPIKAIAFPDEEVAVIDFGLTSSPLCFVMIGDEQAAVTDGINLKLINMAQYALESTQPPTPQDDEDAENDDDNGTDTPGIINSIVYDSTHSRIWGAQDDGDVIYFDLNNISELPRVITVAEGKSLGPIAIDSNHNYIAIGNSSEKKIHMMNTSSQAVESITVTIAEEESITFTGATYANGHFFFSTSVGEIAYIEDAGTVASTIDVGDVALGKIGKYPNENYLYVIDTTNNGVAKIDTSSLTVTKSATDIQLSENAELTSVVITEVTNPSATYAYVAGALGVSVINAGNDVVLDMNSESSTDYEPIPTTATPFLMAASSSTDGYVYSANSVATVSVFTANPWITIQSLIYSGGGSVLTIGESATITFQSDLDGTYEIKSNGDVNASGTAIVDTSGSSTGSATSGTDIEFTFNYDDNSSAFEEGENNLFVFLTDADDNRGRKAAALTVDTPPPALNLISTGFGDERVYLTFGKLDVADIAHYYIYCDTDPTAVTTKSSASGQVTQPESDDNITTAIDGLINGETYYLAAEAIDNAGNVGVRTYAFSDGERVYARPEFTLGPLSFMGETGCNITNNNKFKTEPTFLIIFACLFILLIKLLKKHPSAFLKKNGFYKKNRFNASGKLFLICIIAFAATTFLSSRAQAQFFEKKETPQMWEFGIKTGFWLPQSSVMRSFVGRCCNIITRVQGGFLYQKRYGIEAGAGFYTRAGRAIGMLSGQPSQDHFRLFLVPFELNAVWRADYFSWRYLIPYVKFGGDATYYHESVRKRSIQGMKYGLHGVGGVQFNIGEFGDLRFDMDSDYGINDLFLTLEAQYSWINNFGSKTGADLSGWLFSMGFLFLF